MEPSYRADTPSSSSSSSRYQKPTTTINPSSESAPARGAALAPARGEPSRPILTSSITDPSFATLQRQYHPSSTHTLGEPSDSVGGPSVVTTRSGRHLHLLAPLQSRTLSALSGARPSTSSSISAIGPSSSVPSSLSTHHSIPSIKIPANPYAGYPLPLSHSALSAGGSSSYTRGGNNDVGPPPFTSAGYDSHLYRYSHSPYGLAGSSSTPYLSLHSTSSSAGAGAIDPLTGDRLARSPHPPLTASIRPDAYHLWPPSLGQHHDSRLSPAGPAGANRPYYSSPLNDIQPLSASPYQNYQSYLQSQQSSFPHPGHHRTLSSNLTVLPPLRPSSSGDGSSSYNHLSAPHTAVPTTSGRSPYQTHHRASPFFIPPPLRFNYSQSPPTPQHFYEQENGDMPPRRKAAPVAGTASYGQPTPSTPQTVNSSSAGGSSVRRRPSGPKGNGWTMEHTYDSVGQKKEVIVIDDSESPHHAANKPVTRKRTRAQAAAEAAALSQQSSQTNGHYAPSTVNGGGSSTSGSAKKRKVDDPYDIPAKKTTKPKASGTAGSTYTQTSAIQPRAAPVAPGVPPQPPWDDSEGHYIVRPDDVIGGRYKIVRLLGQGTFGKVVEARHIETRRKVAIKVIRAVQKYRDASKIEIRVLEALKKNDPPNANKCIHLDEYFDFRNHPCLVSELYGMSVYDFLKQNSFQPFPEKHIQDFAKSLLKSVDFLHRLKLVHTDLKPENILLVSNESRLQGPRVKNAKSKSILRSTDIRLIDFGSATFENEYHSSVVSTRHYRAPEIILGLPWSYPCDLFSIGCILVEFYTGDALFQTHDNLEHLAMMEVVMGKMPPRMIERGRQKKPEFFKGNKIDFPNSTVSRSSRKFVKGLKSLPEIIPSTSPQNRLFLDLIVRLLDFDPDSRISVAAALDHPYCRQEIPPPPLT